MIKKIILLVSLCLLIGGGQAFAASDWKQCDTKIVIINTTNHKLFYRILWVDHDLENHRGPCDRAGGELQPFKFHDPTSQFRLCPGRHIVIWRHLTRTNSDYYHVYLFTVTPEMKNVAIAPNVVKCKEISEVPILTLKK